MTVQGIIEGSRSWSDLFQPANFFEEYSDYIMVTSSCNGDSSLWFGAVEAKLRQLNNHIASGNKVSNVRIWPMPFEKKEGTTMRQMWFFGLKMMVGHTPEAVQDPMHYFTDLCITTVPKLNSPHMSSFTVTWQHLQKSQLGQYLTKQQLSLGRSEKLSYAAVTLGQGNGSTMTSPMVLTSMAQTGTNTGYMNTAVPILSPATQSQGDYRTMSHPQYNRVFPPPIAGMNPVMPPQNYIVYSVSGSQHGSLVPGQVMANDQYHSGAVPPPAGAQKQMSMVSRPPGHMLTFPPNRSHTSPQPGGYPNNPGRQAQGLDTLLRPRTGAAANVKSPQTPGTTQTSSTMTTSQPHRSSPGPGYVSAPSHMPSSVSGTSFPHPIPQLTSYPPPPISPMSQFNSPPPPVPKLLAAPPPLAQSQASLQRSDSGQSLGRGDDPGNLRVPGKRQKVLYIVICFNF